MLAASRLSLRAKKDSKIFIPMCREFHLSATAHAKKTIADLSNEIDLSGQTVFVRADLNVPVKGGVVKDATRINLSAPTIQFLLEKGCKVIASSHMGRPKGQIVEDKKLSQIVDSLSAAVGTNIKMAPGVIDEETKAFVQDAKPGEVVLLENLRFHDEETKNVPDFAKSLQEVSGASIYVNDAFGAAHRAHASTHGIVSFVEHKVAGLLMNKELSSLDKICTSPERPCVAAIGGAKVSTKLPILESLLEKCDTILIGGGMMFTFNKALGYNIGKSLLEEDLVDTAKEFLSKAKLKGVNVILPRDMVVAPDLDEAKSSLAVHAECATYEGDGLGVDIGPLAVGEFYDTVKECKTFLWNGPMGVLEIPRYAIGSDSLTRMAAYVTAQGGMAVVGGGDSLLSVQKLEQFDNITHVSTGGGAMLEFIEGKVLPGVEVLDEK